MLTIIVEIYLLIVAILMILWCWTYLPSSQPKSPSKSPSKRPMVLGSPRGHLNYGTTDGVYWDMPIGVSNKLCPMCPFSRRSVPAAFSMTCDIVSDAMRGLQNDLMLLCMDASRPNQPRACLGSLIFRKNCNAICLDLHNFELEALQTVDVDHAVFASWQEFHDHHCANGL